MDRYTIRKSFVFRTHTGNQINGGYYAAVELVTVEGWWDNECRKWVGPPTVIDSHGVYNGTSVASVLGVEFPKAVDGENP